MPFRPVLIFLPLLLLALPSCQAPASTPTEHFPELYFPESGDTLNYVSGIRCVFQDSRGNYWIGSHSEGVCRFDGEKLTYFTSADGLSHPQIRRIQEDAQGNIWFDTGGSHCMFDGQRIVQAEVNPNPPYQPWSLNPTDLWFNAGRGTGAFRLNGKYLDFLDLFEPNGQHSGSLVASTAFSHGAGNKMWIATYSGWVGYDGQHFEVYDNSYFGYNEETGYLHVRSIFEDSKGRLWIGNNGIGVMLKEGDSIVNFSDQHGLIHPESHRSGHRSPPGTLEHVFAISEDQHGNIWFGDRDTGAWRYDGAKFEHFDADQNLKSPMIWDIHEDHHGNLLFSMADGGVYRFDGTQLVWVF